MRQASQYAKAIAKAATATIRARERHSAARIDAKASETGCCAMTVQLRLAMRAEAATISFPAVSFVTTADPGAPAMADLSRSKSLELTAPRKTRLMSGWAIRRP